MLIIYWKKISDTCMYFQIHLSSCIFTDGGNAWNSPTAFIYALRRSQPWKSRLRPRGKIIEGFRFNPNVRPNICYGSSRHSALKSVKNVQKKVKNSWNHHISHKNLANKRLVLNEMFQQNLIYFMYKKTHVVFCLFSFCVTLIFSFMNAVVYVLT